MTFSQLLAEWIATTKISKMPPVVLDKAKKCILDTLGVTIGGTQDEAGMKILAYVEALAGMPNCRVIGTRVQTAAPVAALANGVLGHALDFDDTSHSYIGHVSASILPAVLAAAELAGASGSEAVEAYVIGTEVACKVGGMVSPKLYEDGWHSTCIIGAFGAAAGAGKLLGLTVDEMSHALGIAVSTLSGMRGNIGSSAKPFQVGRSAENGVVSALLAQKGVTASADIFEKKYGFCHTFKLRRDFKKAAGSLGKPFDIDQPGFFLKEFPTCSSTHPALNAFIDLIKKHQISPGEVESVQCAATPLAVTSLFYDYPKDVTEARFSVQFPMAVALFNKGRVTVKDFRDDVVSDPELRTMMQKIHLKISPELEKKGYAPPDGPEAAIVEVNLKNGRRYRAQNSFPDWCPERMPSWETLAEKYRACASIVLPEKTVERSINRIMRLDRVNNLREVTALLVP